MCRDSMLFYRSYMEALNDIEDPAVFRQIVEAIFYYACDGKEPDPSQLGTVEARIFWKLVKPLISANVARRENGRLGGRPPKHQADPPKPEDPEGDVFAAEKKTIGFDTSKPMVSEKKTIGFDTSKPMVSEKKTIGYAYAKPNKEVDKDIYVDKEIYGDINGDINGDIYGGVYINTPDTPRTGAKEDPPDPQVPRGDHKRVLLTESQLSSLKEKYGADTVREYIRRLDVYLASGGHKSNHDLVIEDWIIRDRQQGRRDPCRQQKGGFHNFRERDYDYDLLAEKLRET